MAVKRAFFFGCSFTSYGWPTWADAMGHTLHAQGYEYYNFGLPGAGNDLIFKTMMRAQHEYNITSDDLVMVMWTSWNREDRYLHNQYGDTAWQLQGNVLNSEFYDQDFISKYWSLENDVITSITAISAARALFDINYEASLAVTESVPEFVRDDPVLSAMTEVQMPNVIPDTPNQTTALGAIDGHPDIPAVIQYVDQVVTPVTGIALEQGTRDWLNQFDDYMTATLAPVDQAMVAGHLDLAKKMWRKLSNKIYTHHNDVRKQYMMMTDGPELWRTDRVLDYLQGFGSQAER